MIKREKRRYLALNVESEQPFDEREVLDAVHVSVLRLFGEYGASKADIKLIKGYSRETSIGYSLFSPDA